MHAWQAVLAVSASFALTVLCAPNQIYDIGVGIADVTGPAAGVNMMGYANPGQTTRGIHTRQWSRAFIIGQGDKRVVFVTVEAAMISHGIKAQVVKELHRRHGKMYSSSNVCLSATHTHSGPGGFMEYVLYLVTSLGFIQQTYDALVQGIVKSIERAHASIEPGFIYWDEGDLTDASINRSPTAYAKNPAAERSKYARNVDTKMFLLKLTDVDGHPRGMINWFPVHGTSMNNTNRLISSDNKGYASLLFEQRMNGPSTLPGKGDFVAAFAQSNEGDVSPNIKGPRCQDTGEVCDKDTSTCKGQSQLCIATGPGTNMKESTRIIGQRQFMKARELFDRAKTRLHGPVNFRQQFLNMSNVEIELTGKKVRTCKPAVGHSFAAGTTDGPGMFSFQQGTRAGQVKNNFWSAVSRFIRQRSSEIQDKCHHPKPIVLDTGELDFPYPWQPFVVDTQVLRIGNLFILAVPGEYTTMAGRRLKNVIQTLLDAVKEFVPDGQVVIAGLSNNYAGYVTTPEEYQVQRYEGASTLYGPYTLPAYIQQYLQLTKNLLTNRNVVIGPRPPDLYDQQVTLLPGNIIDTAPVGKNFGGLLADVKSKYSPGTEAKAGFICGHPRNNLQLESTFLTVDLWDKSRDKWRVVATDANWETTFEWRRSNTLLGRSVCMITWNIPSNVQPGRYRFRHFGFRRTLFGSVSGYSGMSSVFNVTAL